MLITSLKKLSRMKHSRYEATESEYCSKYAAPRSDPKKLYEFEKVKTKTLSRSALSQSLIFRKVTLCRQGICIFVSKSQSVWVFSRCLQLFSYFLKVAQSVFKVPRQIEGTKGSGAYRVRKCHTRWNRD